MTEWGGLLASLMLALGVGAALGALYFRLLWRAAQGLAEGRDGAARLVLGFGLRLALALGALALALRLGAGAGHLLAGVLGFVLARQGAVRRHRRKD